MDGSNTTKNMGVAIVKSNILLNFAHDINSDIDKLDNSIDEIDIKIDHINKVTNAKRWRHNQIHKKRNKRW